MIASILEKKYSNPQYSQFNDQDRDIYYSALLDLVDRHITGRHTSIRKKIKNSENLTEQKESIKFKDIFDIFSKVFHNIDKDYLELLCQRKFNRAYNSKLENLSKMVVRFTSQKNAIKALEISNHYKNLKRYYEITLIPIYRGKFRKLVRELMPNVLNKDYSDLDFYHKLTESNLLDKVLFDFLCRVSKITSHNPKVFYNDENKSYYASCIDLSDQDIEIENNNVLNFQDEMQRIVDNYQPNEHLLSANYFVVKSHDSNPFKNQTIFLQKIIDIPIEPDEPQTITEHNVFLKDIKIAAQELNDE